MERKPDWLPGFPVQIYCNKEVKWSKHAPQTVEIYYNGIGFIDKQHQDMESLQPLKAEEPRQAS